MWTKMQLQRLACSITLTNPQLERWLATGATCRRELLVHMFTKLKQQICRQLSWRPQSRRGRLVHMRNKLQRQTCRQPRG